MKVNKFVCDTCGNDIEEVGTNTRSVNPKPVKGVAVTVNMSLPAPPPSEPETPATDAVQGMKKKRGPVRSISPSRPRRRGDFHFHPDCVPDFIKPLMNQDGSEEADEFLEDWDDD